MDQTQDRALGPLPSTASIQVRELSWQGLHNPHPQSKDPDSREGLGKRLVEECLSPARLRALAQVDDLRLVSVLEMCVDTREHSLGNFGLHLPNLSQLKLNDSRLGSVSDVDQTHITTNLIKYVQIWQQKPANLRRSHRTGVVLRPQVQ